MDFLVVNAIRDIGRAIRLIQSRYAPELVPDGETVRFVQTSTGKEIPTVQAIPYKNGIVDVWKLPEEQAVYTDICKGKVETVFQLSGAAARQGLRAFGLRDDGTPALSCIEDLSAFTALDRPGPLDAYVEDPETGEKHNMLVEYAHRARREGAIGRLASLDALIPETYGVIVYQEQLQHIFRTVGGTTGIQANDFRQRIGKKKIVDVRQKDKPLFMAGANPTLGEAEATKLWSMMETFGQYGFNKSVLGTVILDFKGGSKQLQDFKGGEIVSCVDENGCVQETEVVALHDHGTLEAFEVELDDGYTVTVSANHKFLTPDGQLPLFEILARGLPILCAPHSRKTVDC
jgi:DNA polymerase III alpha subunit